MPLRSRQDLHLSETIGVKIHHDDPDYSPST
jgi:hypothetical protein